MATEKYLRITMPDDSQWDVPMIIIAEDRARYYAQKDAYAGQGVYIELYHDELAGQDDDDLLDWAANNMNWSEVADRAVRVDTPLPPVDYQEGWMNGDKEIVER